MIKKLILVLLLINCCAAMDYLPESTMAPGADLSMFEGDPGNIEMYGGRVLNATELYNYVPDGKFEILPPRAMWANSDVDITWESTTCKGLHSANITSNGSDGYAMLYISGNTSERDWTHYAPLAGENVSVGCWVYVPSTNDKLHKLCIADSVGATYYTLDQNDDAWHWIELTRTINSSSWNARIKFIINDGGESDTDDYIIFDNMTAVKGATVYDYDTSDYLRRVNDDQYSTGGLWLVGHYGNGALNLVARSDPDGDNVIGGSDYPLIRWWFFNPLSGEVDKAVSSVAHYKHTDADDGLVQSHWSMESADASGVFATRYGLYGVFTDEPYFLFSNTLENITCKTVMRFVDTSSADAGYINVYGDIVSNNAYLWIDPYGNTAATDGAYVGLFRHTNTTGTRAFRVYSGDGTPSIAFSVNAGSGDITVTGNMTIATGKRISFTGGGYLDASGWHT